MKEIEIELLRFQLSNERAVRFVFNGIPLQADIDAIIEHLRLVETVLEEEALLPTPVLAPPMLSSQRGASGMDRHRSGKEGAGEAMSERISDARLREIVNPSLGGQHTYPVGHIQHNEGIEMAREILILREQCRTLTSELAKCPQHNLDPALASLITPETAR